MNRKVKETYVIIRILCKRLLYRKGLFLCLLAIPFLMLAVQALEKDGETDILAGVYTEQESTWNEQLRRLLTETDGSIQFVSYQDFEVMQQDIVAGRIECGYILQEDLQNRMERQHWNHAVTVYESAHSLLTPVINEVFFEQLFTLVSSEWFEGYVANYEGFAEIDRQELWKAIRLRLREQLENGTLFSVEHYDIEEYEVESSREETSVPSGQAEVRVFPVRGIAAVMILLCGLIGLFDSIADRSSGPFPVKRRQKTVSVLDVVLPVSAATTLGLVTLVFSGEWKGAVEIPQMFLYSILVVIWCLLLGLFIQSEKVLAVLLPVLVLCSLILPPVFLDLSAFLPGFGVLEKWLPVTYYLRWN